MICINIERLRRDEVGRPCWRQAAGHAEYDL